MLPQFIGYVTIAGFNGSCLVSKSNTETTFTWRYYCKRKENEKVKKSCEAKKTVKKIRQIEKAKLKCCKEIMLSIVKNDKLFNLL